ncbi:MAG: hypothetical protein KDH15_20155 [Rhodocyclaceae bacterium]|nr:hypothetical protein [Rhodocyclaceae bacterium]
MNPGFADLLPGAPGGGNLRVWLKSAAYTRRLLLGEGGDPWQGAAQYLAWFSQAHGLLRPDVAVIEVGDLYQSLVRREPALATEMAAKRRLAWPLRRLLESTAPRALLAEVIEAVIAHLRGQAPLVLAVPSPRQWLLQANRMAGRDAIELDPDSIEDAAMYVADVLRSVSHLPVGGLLLEERIDDGELGPVDVERYRPLINVARHYRWTLGLRLGKAALLSIPDGSDLDVLIGDPALVNDAGCAIGVDVGRRLWAAEAPPPLEPRQFYFAEVPAEQKPEHVLDCLAQLRSLSSRCP